MSAQADMANMPSTGAFPNLGIAERPAHAPQSPSRSPGLGRGARSNPLLVAACLATAACATVAPVERGPVISLLEVRRQHVVVQKFDLSCGAAALTTLLNFQHGEQLTEREVAIGLMQRSDYVDDPDLVRRREGFSLLDLKRYVQSRGYDGVGYGNLDFSELLDNAPVMVPVNLAGYNHFVIFRGVVDGRALLADPAWGNRSLPAEVFRDAWIDYPGLGKVGFVIKRRDGRPPVLDRLAPPPGSVALNKRMTPWRSGQEP